MKKMIIPLILILILTGCSRIKNTDNYVEIVNNIISYNNKKVNNKINFFISTHPLIIIYKKTQI